MRAGGVIRSVIVAVWSRASRTGTGPGSRGVTCRGTCSGRGRRSGSGTAVMPVMARGIGCWAGFSRKLTRQGRSTGRYRWTRRSRVRSSTQRTRPARSRTQGAGSNHKNLPWHEVEPAGHGIGRSRGGLTTKIHQAVDGRGRPLAMVITGGQRNDGAMLARVLAEIHVPRLGAGRPRTRPDAVLADRAYTSGVTRTELRRAASRPSFPRSGTRSPLGSAAALAAADRRRSTPKPTKNATSLNGPSPSPSNGGASPPATTSSPSPIAQPSQSAQSSPGYAI